MTEKDDLPSVVWCDEGPYHRWVMNPRAEDIDHFFAKTPEELEARETAHWAALCGNNWATKFERAKCVRVSRFKEIDDA